MQSNGWNPVALSPALSRVLEEVRRTLGYRFTNEDQLVTRTNLGDLVHEVATRLGFELSSFERDEIVYHLETDNAPFGILQSLIDDQHITDIIISGYSKIAVQHGRKNFLTPLSFPSKEAYDALVERLLLRAGTVCTTKQPIADGMIGPYIRIHAVHESLCETGPYVTIRINRFSTIALDHLVSVGMAPREVFDYLAAIVAAGQTLMVIGEVGTGKTTVARALAATIPQDESILVIEDTREIRLEHPHVRYVSTRTDNSEGTGRVSPAECIRAGMRMAMNRIIFGEIRDAEAAEAFVDVCASGHAGLSTMHARTAADALTRLELFLGRAQRGVERSVIASQISTAVQVVVGLDVCRFTGNRRIVEVRELGAVADGVIRQREIFSYQYKNEIPSWEIVNRASIFRDALDRVHYGGLNNIPGVLELSAELAYREVQGLQIAQRGR